jgi:phosphoribosylformylglycinamidine synthase
LAVALAESCFSSLNRSSVGASVLLSGPLSIAAHLFSESPSRIIISFKESALNQVEEIARRAHCPLTMLGRTGGEQLRIAVNGEEIFQLNVNQLEAHWRTSLGRKLQAEIVQAAAE